MFLNIVCYCKIGTLCELVCEQMFFFIQQNFYFSLFLIGIEKFFAPTRIIFASVSDIKSINSIANNLWILPQRLLAFISPNYSRVLEG